MKNVIIILTIFSLVLSSGCNSGPVCNKPYILVGNRCCLDENDNKICDSDETTTSTSTSTTTTSTTTTVPKTDPVIKRAEPYLNKIVFKDVDLRRKSASIVGVCPSGDKECQVNALYRYIVENYNYYSDPRGDEFIQAPSETMNVKGGDCEDLTILLNSLMENLGIKTYLVLTENHAYSLACGINPDDLWQYIQESVVTQFSEDIGETGSYKAVVENGNLFIVYEKREGFVLNGGYIVYYGGDGSEFISPVEYMDVRYDITSSQPVTVYVVPSRDDYELYTKGRKFTHYPSCEKQNVLQTSESCGPLTNYGGLVLVNGNMQDATIDLNRKFYFLYSPYEFLGERKILYYHIDGQECVVLDATAGKYGYPGYGANLGGRKIAIDPVTKEYVYLE